MQLPFPEYPRPSLCRKQWINLNGYWDFAITENRKTGPESFNRHILVPFAVETEASEITQTVLPEDTLWYRRTFQLQPKDRSSRQILHFEAVDWECSCFMNGKRVGEHRGGYLPFSFDITEALLPPKNGEEPEQEILLRVSDPTDTENHQRGKQVLDPQFIFYTATSGIWQSVWLEPVPLQNHLVALHIEPRKNPPGFEITVQTRLPGQFSAEFSEEAPEDSWEPREKTVSSEKSFFLPLKNPRFWSPEDPYLYPLTLRLFNEGSQVEAVESYGGFRFVERRPGPQGRDRIELNGKPVFLNGLLDQGYWPKTGMTAPDDAALLFDLNKAKEMGFNTLRKHIKIETRRWYYYADRLGMLVLQDMVSGGRNRAGDLLTKWTVLTGQRIDDRTPSFREKTGRGQDEIRREFENELDGMVDNLHCHPSILIWCVFNESWGQYNAQTITLRLRKKDPSRLIDSHSGWYDQKAGDFLSRHTYLIPLKNPIPFDRRIYLISEYGGYNLEVKDHLWQKTNNFGYVGYKTPEALARAYTRLLEKQVFPLLKKGLCGVIYTQLSDVEIETNGLLTFDRQVEKIQTKHLAQIHRKLFTEWTKNNKSRQK